MYMLLNFPSDDFVLMIVITYSSNDIKCSTRKNQFVNRGNARDVYSIKKKIYNVV